MNEEAREKVEEHIESRHVRRVAKDWDICTVVNGEWLVSCSRCGPRTYFTAAPDGAICECFCPTCGRCIGTFGVKWVNLGEA